MNELCTKVSESLASVLSGEADESLYAHIADCTECRDLKYDAEQVAKKLVDAGADFVMPDDMEARLFAALDTRTEPQGGGENRPVASNGKIDATAATMPVEAVVLEDTAAVKNLENALSQRKAEPLRLKQSEHRAKRFTLAVSAGSALFLAAGVLLSIQANPVDEKTASISDPWKGEVVRVDGDSSDFAICDMIASVCRPAKAGDRIDAGAKIRVGSKSSAALRMSDGTVIALDRDTELEFAKTRGRHANLTRGVLVADVEHIEGDTAEIGIPGGSVRVLGTKFEIVAGERESRVNVSRGTVELLSGSKRELVRRGEEGRMVKGGDVNVFASLRAPEEHLLGERETKSIDGERAAPGLGELRAKKPGQNDEKIGAVRLSRHEVHVRVSDVMARTEIDETFSNNTGDELEGLFRFPLPPDAQIERLALEVNGKLEEAAFVEKDKAAAIWRGVIQHATPLMPKPVEEIIWVPGPWRDPALLEWKRGGRFELKIFPIPAHGSRRVVLSYTQTVPATGDTRHYTYPLPQSGAGLSTVDQVNFDVRVVGAEKGSVKWRGYGATEASENGAELVRFSQSGFLPSGDFSVDYAPKDKPREVMAYGYQPPAGSEDSQPFAVLALRPNLPRAKEEGYRDHVLVVDTSRSMVGERYAQAQRLVTNAIEEMDPRDRVTVLACDVTCREVPGGLAFVSSNVKANATRFLATIQPDGSSNILAMAKAAQGVIARAPTATKTNGWFKSSDDITKRSLHMVYIGDGSASSGPVVPRHLSAEVGRVFSGTDATLTTVAVGQDADTRLLGALARSGGGTLIPFVPGESARTMGAKIALAASGARIKNATLSLPDGLSVATSTELGTLRAGGEAFVGVRMTRPEVEGEAILRGTVGGAPFERKVPIKVVASADAGNAFVPRLYAAMRMKELEERGGSEAKSEMITLSKRYQLASPYTSLLVLESQAMFTAFGLERKVNMPTWTGDEASNVNATGESAEPSDLARGEKTKELEGMLGEARDKSDMASGSGAGVGGGGMGMGRARASKSEGPRAYDNEAVARSQPLAKPQGESMEAPAAAATVAPQAPAPRTEEAKKAPSSGARVRPVDPFRADELDDRALRRPPPPPPPFRQRMIPMKRVWDRQGYVRTDVFDWKSRSQSALMAAETKALSSPDSRDAMKGLYAAVARFGDIHRARDLAEQWAARDALDVEALIARADTAARLGDRETAVRILGGTVDVRRDDVTLQSRLSDLYARLNDQEQSCAHRIALAEEKVGDVDQVARAVLCARNLGKSELAANLASDVPADKQSALQTALGKVSPGPEAAMAGDVRLTANWSSADDLDVSLVDANGVRISWMGGRAKVGAEGAIGSGRESLAVRDLKPGSYLVEISRSKKGYGAPVSGEIEIFAVSDSRPAEGSGGERKRIPFSLTGERTEVARVEISYTSRLVEAWDVGNRLPPPPVPTAVRPTTPTTPLNPWGRPFTQ